MEQPHQDPVDDVKDPPAPGEPEEYKGYDEADAESFPASDPPAAAEPGV